MQAGAECCDCTGVQRAAPGTLAGQHGLVCRPPSGSKVQAGHLLEPSSTLPEPCPANCDAYQGLWGQASAEGQLAVICGAQTQPAEGHGVPGTILAYQAGEVDLRL